MNYLDAGYNEFLAKTLTPTSSVDSLSFDQDFQGISGDRIQSNFSGTLVGSGINASNITAGQMSFDRARGGSLILGGQNNQNGTFALRDDADNDRITMDKDGMIINQGAMTIKNSTNQTIVDATGLVSTNNFQTDTYSDVNNQTTSSTSFVDVTNASLNFILTRTSKVLFLASAAGRETAAGNGTAVVIVVDGTKYGPSLNVQAPLGATPSSGSSTHVFLSLAAGAHNVKLQFCVADGGGGRTANIDDKRLTYIIYGS